MDTLVQIINTMGFPIAMVCYFIWDKSKLTDKLVSAINNNTTIMTRLLDKLDCSELVENPSTNE